MREAGETSTIEEASPGRTQGDARHADETVLLKNGRKTEGSWVRRPQLVWSIDAIQAQPAAQQQPRRNGPVMLDNGIPRVGQIRPAITTVTEH